MTETRMLPRPDVGFDFEDDQALGRAQKTASAMPSVSEVGVDESRTAAGRLAGMLESDSPLMRRARTQGLQVGNQRGLLNSSMAVGAAQGAMIDRAEPYALSDSANLTADARQNAAAQNERSLLQASMLGDSYLSNQDFQQRYGMASQLVQEEGDQAMRQSYGSSVANAWGVMGTSINRIVSQAMNDINDIQNNPNIDASDKTEMIKQIQSARDVDVAFQSDLFEQFPQVLDDTGVFPPLEP